MLALDLSALSPAQRVELVQITDELERRAARRYLPKLFPDSGPLRRELYPKHLEFFAAGATHRERVFLAGNRVGKTLAAGCEVAYHLTGAYPAWWTGRRFTGPVRVLATGDTHETTRDILQDKLLGGTTDRPEKIGTGLIPGDSILSWVPRPHVKGAIERASIRHVTGAESELWLRSYEQGREIFQGFELDVFWADEECPQDVYSEGLVRLMTRKGLGMLTFTPLSGLTELVAGLLSSPDTQAAAGRSVVQCGWDDVPHLDEQIKSEMLARLPPHQRDARTRGIPALGSGAIYPVPESDIVVAPFEIPPHWPRAYGMDVGWNRTAVVWGAIDRANDCLYLYSEHYRGQAEPSIHAEAIKARGDWIPGVIDPASRGRSQADGQQLFEQYTNLGLELSPAVNAVEAGLYEVWQRLSTGRLKVFKSMSNWLSEYRVYRRDVRGKVVKENDHAQDACRYLVTSGLDVAKVNVERDRVKRVRNWRTA